MHLKHLTSPWTQGFINIAAPFQEAAQTSHHIMKFLIQPDVMMRKFDTKRKLFSGKIFQA